MKASKFIPQKDEKVNAVVKSAELPKEVEKVKEEPKIVVGTQGYELKKDFTKQLRSGDTLTIEKYNELKSRGIDVDVYL